MKKSILILTLLIAAFAFGQTKQIGIWVEYVDYDGEYVEILEALDGATEFDYELHEFWDYMAINTDSLNNIDVFVQPELESGGYSMGRPAGEFLSSILRPWVESGGLVVSMYSHGRDFLNGADFDSIGGSTEYTSGDILEVVLPSHPLAEGVSATFSGMNASNAFSYYGDYTPVVTTSGSYMHTGFQEFGAGAVVFFGWDYFDDPTPNQDRLFQNAIAIWGNASEGPILREFFPDEGSYVSVDTPIVMVFEDEEGVDISSFSADVNGITYTGASPDVSLGGDSVIIDITDLSEGEVEVMINSVADPLGNLGPDTVNAYSFYVDKTPPELHMNFPSGVITSMPTGAEIRFWDELSGTGHERWYLSMPGDDSITAGDPEILAEDDSLIFVIFSASDIIITPNDTNWVEFTVWDSPDIGEANDTTYRWWFFPEVDGIEERGLPGEIGISILPNPFNRACRIIAPWDGIIEIYNTKGEKVNELPAGTEYWRPSNEVGTGIYFFRVQTKNGYQIQKAVYAK